MRAADAVDAWSLPMTATKTTTNLTPTARRQEVASILAKGVLRWHRRAKAAGIAEPAKPPPIPEKGLEFLGETRLSVPHGTRGLSPRDAGDEA